MFGADNETEFQKKDIEMGQKMLDVGQKIQKLLEDNPDFSKSLDNKFLKVFGEVLAHVGQIFKEDVTTNKRLQLLLTPLSSYANLMSYFLLIKSILEGFNNLVKLDCKEHKERLEWINKQLARIASETTVIAQRLADFGKSLKDIILEKNELEKSAKLKIFDIDYDEISNSLDSCISDMVLVKEKIDEGFRSISVFKTKTLIAFALTGVCAVAVAIIAPLVVGYFGLIAGYGVFDMIGVGTISALAVATPAAYPLLKAHNSAKTVQECYKDQEFNWKTLDEKLQTMKKDLRKLQEHRSKIK